MDLEPCWFDGPEAAARVPTLVAPFALAGLCGGLLAGRALTGPMIDVPLARHASTAIVPIAAITAGVLGWLLGWRCRRALARGAIPRRLVDIVLLAATGWLIGAAVTACCPHAEPGGMWLGMIVALPFYPICAIVVSSARRAGRARHGSLVAASDRRAVWSSLAAAVALFTLVALPEWERRHLGFRGPPEVAIYLAVAMAVLLVALGLFDLRADRRLAALVDASGAMELLSPSDRARGDGAKQRSDFGLGDAMRGTAGEPVGYRAAPPLARAVVGDPVEAMLALGANLARTRRRAYVVLVVIAIHCAATWWTML